MSFPNTPTLDIFNRADEAPMSGFGWSNLPGYDPQSPNLIGFQVVGANPSEDSSMAWFDGTIGPNGESFCTIATLPASGEMIGLWLRLVNETDCTIFNGYQIRVAPNGDGAGHDQIRFNRYDPGPSFALGTQLSAVTLAANYAPGDQFGVSMNGTVMFAYRNGANIGSYDTAGDSTKYSAAGKIGFTIRNNTGAIDDFGGGTYTPPAPSSLGPRASLGRFHM